MCEEPQTEQQWYAIRVTYSREMAAKSYLDSIGIESYVPMHFAERTYGGKRRKVWEPLIHNLLFIRTSADRLREKGDPVRVTEGIFAGIEGRYIRHKGHSKVAVAIRNVATALTAYIPLKYIAKID